MPDAIDEVRARIESVAGELQRLTLRIERLEGAAGGRADGPVAEEPPAAAGAPASVPGRQGLLTLGGRTLVALAGGYLLRALTAAGALPALAGVAAGLAYALVWVVLAGRAAAAGKRWSAGAHASASALIAYPLLWESTTRLQALSPREAFAALVGVGAAASVLAARRRLGILAGLHTVLALFTAAALLLATRELAAGVGALLALAAMVEALADRDLWPALRWPAALASDAGVALLVWLCGRAGGLPEGYRPISTGTALAEALALPAVFLASIAVRTLWHGGHRVTPFEVAQSLAALAIGFGGAGRLVGAAGGSPRPLAAVGLALGAAAYVVAFARAGGPEARRANFHFYAHLGGLLMLLGSRALLPPRALPLLWCTLALAALWLGQRWDQLALRWHGAAYLLAAGLGSGLLSTVARNLLGHGADAVPLPSAEGWLTALATLGGGAMLVAGARSARSWWRDPPHGLVAWLTLAEVGGILSALLARGLELAAHPATLATLRTGVLAALAVALAGAARRERLADLGHFVHPLLAVGGVKLLLEDLPAGQPATLFASFVLYGLALIGAPRLIR